MFFKDRHDAGYKLAEIVKHQIDGDWDIVGIAKGGVIIAEEIAKSLGTKPKVICIEKNYLSMHGNLTVSSLGSGVVFGKKRNTFLPDISRTYDPELKKLLKEALKR